MSRLLNNVCFTCHENCEVHYQANDLFVYSVCGREVCPTTGKVHSQGFFQLKKRTTLSNLKKVYCKHAHYESMRGTADQASMYCKKEEKFEEFGELRSQGARTDLGRLLESVTEPEVNLREAIMEQPEAFVRTYRGVQHYIAITQPPMERIVEGLQYRPDITPDVFYWCVSQPPTHYAGQKTAIINYDISEQTPLVKLVVCGQPCMLGSYPCRITEVFKE